MPCRPCRVDRAVSTVPCRPCRLDRAVPASHRDSRRDSQGILVVCESTKRASPVRCWVSPPVGTGFVAWESTNRARRARHESSADVAAGIDVWEATPRPARDPRELFVVRNVAALVPVYAPDTGSHAASAALEFAVFALGVRSIVVMGHGRCGGIMAALDEVPPLSSTDFIGTWVAGVRELAADLHPAEADDPARRLHALEHRSIEQSITNLRTFPWIATRELSGALSLHGAWFDIAFGKLDVLTPAGWSRLPGP